MGAATGTEGKEVRGEKVWAGRQAEGVEGGENTSADREKRKGGSRVTRVRGLREDLGLVLEEGASSLGVGLGWDNCSAAVVTRGTEQGGREDMQAGV